MNGFTAWLKANQVNFVAIAGAIGAIAHDSGFTGHDDTIGGVVLIAATISAILKAFLGTDGGSDS